MNAEFDNIVNDYNGGITNANIDAAAAIAASKLDSTLLTTTNTKTVTNKTLTSPTINTPTISGGTIAASTINAPTISAPIATITTVTYGATSTVDLSTGNGPIYNLTLTGSPTLAISNDAAGKIFLIRLIQDGTGSRTVTWFGTVKWAGGTAPTLTTTASKIDVFGFICTSSGNYDGYIIGQNL